MDKSRDYELMVRAWTDERNSPELLGFSGNAIDSLIEYVHMVEEMDHSGSMDRFWKPFYEMEVSRIKYVIKSYLETRLEKIETMAHHLIQVDHAQLEALLSPAELAHLRGFVAIFDEYFVTSVLSRLPDPLKRLDSNGTLAGDKEFQIGPCLDTQVVCRVNTSVGTISIDPKTLQTANLCSGTVYRLAYSIVRPFVHQGSVSLI